MQNTKLPKSLVAAFINNKQYHQFINSSDNEREYMRLLQK